MPSRNIIKIDGEQCYYHVYARGNSKQAIFLEPVDYEYFIHLFKRYLSKEIGLDKSRVTYPHYYNKVNLLCYCLMNNHFHLLIQQQAKGEMAKFMKSLMISYSRYFNLKYERSGSIWESRYKASLVDSNPYLIHISRYIHLNPRYWRNYSYSSIKYYRNNKLKTPSWLTKDQNVIAMQPNEYIQFLKEYKSQKERLTEIKDQLADQ